MGIPEKLIDKSFLKEIDTKSTAIEVEEIHYIFWIAFTSHSIHALQDENYSDNRELQLQLFKGIKENLLNYLDDFFVLFDKAIGGDMFIPHSSRIELSFLEVVIVHDQLEMFCDVLQVNKKEVMNGIGQEYLMTLKKYLEEKEGLYRFTVRYLMAGESG
ncbi:hypothetical protein [Virgibacillus halodenitrificans]|uniref:hypothetical protein n=1 Tax=Virgibacillus halodenitrificans TaxID=1482 RepID=UPI000EF54798|nr:hypothetical protein [Virgibacillus halodenitrificans]